MSSICLSTLKELDVCHIFFVDNALERVIRGNFEGYDYSWTVNFSKLCGFARESMQQS